MPIVGTALADGQLAAPAAPTPTIYGPVAANTVVYVKSIICTNRGGVANTVELAVTRDGANERRLILVPLADGEQLYFDEPLTLEENDIIQGEATNAADVDYVISGGVQT